MEKTVLMQTKVYQWMEMFQSSQPSIADEDHLGHLTTMQTADNGEG
jgi:hypothetical protein